jgi:glycosyltransferase involved in cell wall biosynthesis
MTGKREEVIKLSVIIPCYNEEKTLEKCVERVLKISDDSLQLEIIVVDDCSTDGSQPIARGLENKDSRIIVIQHDKNQGKGAALQTGFKKATGDFIAIQDADLEYNPYDILRLLEPLVNNEADVVFGSRFLPHGPHRVLYFWHSLGNRFLTLISNMFTNLNLTDMEVCYKIFRREVLQNINLEEKRFGFEPEITAKVARLGCRIYEVGISYYGRTYEEGKKIVWKDGIRALWCILKYNLWEV